jgi:hypothetical protein
MIYFIPDMTQKRALIFISAIIGVFLTAYLVILFAKGYRPDFKTKTLMPTGLLVATSLPDGAQIYVNGVLKSATDTTISLAPNDYEVEIKKEGFSSWKKTLKIEKELVTKTDTYLFSQFPDLKALTYTGAMNPLLSPDNSKIVYAVIGKDATKNGLWVLDLNELPFITRDPKMILEFSAKGKDFSKATYIWSPDSRNILLTLKIGKLEENYLIDPNNLNLAASMVNISATLSITKNQWVLDQKERQTQKLKKLPDELILILESSTKNIVLSPDETKILYTATASATLREDLLPPVPAASTQKQERNLKPGQTYVYDIKEDRNFFITDSTPPSWYPTSRHLYQVEKDKFVIMEYDGTNKVAAYSGPFVDLFAFPFPSGTKLAILTSLGKDTPPNLYSVSLR